MGTERKAIVRAAVYYGKQAKSFRSRGLPTEAQRRIVSGLLDFCFDLEVRRHVEKVVKILDSHKD